ncbi:MAG: hypothetical protein ACRENP_05000 [Longimicrobiales bacterium]
MKKETTKTTKTSNTTADEDEILPEYDLTGSVRGKYAARYAEGTNMVRLDPDVAKVFPDSNAVNSALRALVKIIEERSTAA